MAEGSEDAFDAAVSAAVMSAAEPEFRDLGRATDPIALLEGEIWRPKVLD